MKRHIPFVRSAVSMTALLWMGGMVSAKQDWDTVANVKEAANHLAKLHRSQGSQGVLKFLDACYRTHTLASDFNRGLEACMAQDYMHSQVLAVIYAKLPPDQRDKAGAPSPEFIARSMGGRFATVFDQYKIPAEQSVNLKKLIDKHGFPIFLKAVFPQAEKSGEDKK